MPTMNAESKDSQLWADLCEAENAFYAARMALYRDVQDLHALIENALKVVAQRGTALRLLEIRPEQDIRRHLATLVYLASVGHCDIALCRSVLLRIDRDWLIENIDAHVVEVLRNGDDEEYRRFAELYQLLDADLLRAHLDRCACHPSEDIKEIAED